MSGRRRILLVEDVEDNRGIVRQLAARLKAELLEAHDGASGLHMAQQDLPDVILMDMSLPVLDGWETTRALKQDPATAGIPIIALTAHAMAGDRERALSIGCDEYVSKPIDVPSFLELLARYLSGAAA